MSRTVRTAPHAALFVALLAACASDASSTPTDGGTPAPGADGGTGGDGAPGPGAADAEAGVEDAVLVGAGDIVECGDPNHEKTAALLDGIPGTVFLAGDNAYEDGTTVEYKDCYDSSWGRHKARTKPSVGNHEYQSKDAAGYYGYFGAAAGDPKKGYYSYDLGAWHVVVVNSNCDEIGGCDAGSAQEKWLRADLAANPRACTLAYWHHPRFSSGLHGNDDSLEPIWQALYDAGADVVVSGHDHEYERFAAQDPKGAADPTHGLVEFVVGTGGASLRPFGTSRANSEVREENTHGVLKLTLHAKSADYRFIPVAGQTFTDTGTITCHDR